MTTTAEPTMFDALKAALRGPVIQPADGEYDQARAVYNGMIDRRPAAIARCADVADVMAAIRFARERDLTVSVRGGGHNAGGLGVWDDALVVDLSARHGVTVDPAAKTVLVQGGDTIGDIDHATGGFGLATPSGILSTTGVAGLTLGGGIGYLARRFGLTIDNLLSANVVLADGSFATADADTHPDLFWALKGGGGNCGIVWCYTGPPQRAGEALAPVRGFGSPLLDGVQPMPFSMLQGAFDALYPPGLQWYWRADFIRGISDAAIAVHEEFGAALPTAHSTMHMYPIDGAVHRVAADATAFAYRDVGWAGVIVGVDPEPSNADKIRDWAVRYWEALHPTSAGGAYVNFMMDEGTDRVRASYGHNYDRLARVKASYDPDNFFRINQNIRPAG